MNDYKMVLVEARQNECKFHNVDNKDFFNLLRILLNNNKPFNEVKKEAIEYTKEHETQNEGRIKGIIEMGLECGLSEDDILEKLEHKLNVSRQKAKEYFQKYAAETV